MFQQPVRSPCRDITQGPPPPQQCHHILTPLRTSHPVLMCDVLRGAPLITTSDTCKMATASSDGMRRVLANVAVGEGCHPYTM